jgi:glucose-6-phosphate-specific signal transduction histidine kinase
MIESRLAAIRAADTTPDCVQIVGHSEAILGLAYTGPPRRKSEQAWLEVEDHGKGKGNAAGAFQPGIGLTGMRERVKNLAGVVEIQSGQNGSRVKAALPLIARAHKIQTNKKTLSATG